MSVGNVLMMRIRPPGTTPLLRRRAATNGQAGQREHAGDGGGAGAGAGSEALDTLREAQRERMGLTIDVIPQRVTATQNQILLLCRTGTFMHTGGDCALPRQPRGRTGGIVVRAWVAAGTRPAGSARNRQVVMTVVGIVEGCLTTLELFLRRLSVS